MLQHFFEGSKRRLIGFENLLRQLVQGEPGKGVHFALLAADFALKIISNPFIPDRELGAIQMEAYTAILNGESIADVHYKYDRQIDTYVIRHTWD